jgi:hypothetical protein
MIPLRFRHANDSAFPSLPPLDAIKKAASCDELERTFLAQHVALASQDRDPRSATLRTALRRTLRRTKIRGAIREPDACLLGDASDASSWRVKRATHSIDTRPPRELTLPKEGGRRVSSRP